LYFAIYKTATKNTEEALRVFENTKFLGEHSSN